MTSLVEKALKSQGLDFYSISNAKDFAYVVDDLRPQIVVIEAETILEDLVLFRDQYESTEKLRGAKVVIINNCDELAFLEKTSELELPIDPFQLKDFFAKI